MYLVNYLEENRGTSCKSCQRSTNCYLEQKYMNFIIILFTFDTSKSMLRNGTLQENTLCTLIFCLLKDLHKA